NQIAWLQAARHLVQVVEAGGHADHASGVVLYRLNTVVVVVEHLLYRGEVLGGRALGNAEENLFGLVEGLVNLVFFGIAEGRDLPACRYEPPQDRRALYYAPVILYVDGGGRAVY